MQMTTASGTSSAKAAWKETEGFSLTYLPFIARAFADTVHEFPKVNASVGEDALIVHHDVNLSIAVDLDFQDLPGVTVDLSDLDVARVFVGRHSFSAERDQFL